MTEPLFLRKINPRRRPDWRFHRAMEIANYRVQVPRARANRRWDDRQVATAGSYFFYWIAGDSPRHRELLISRFPELFRAHAMHISDTRADKALVFQLECCLLAGESDDQTARRVGLAPEVVGWYEAIFFNVRDRLQGTGWIHWMLRKKYRLPGPREPFVIQFLSYCWGPRALDFLLFGADPCDRPSSAQQAESFFDRQTRRDIQRKALLANFGDGLDGVGVFDLLKLQQRLTKTAQKTKAGEKDENASKVEAVADGLLRDLAWMLPKRDRAKKSTKKPIVPFAASVGQSTNHRATGADS